LQAEERLEQEAKLKLCFNYGANVVILPLFPQLCKQKFAKTGCTSAKNKFSALGLHCFCTVLLG